MRETIWQDARSAARSLWRTPAFTAAVVITIALGIGGNTAIFSLIEAVMLRTLPVAAPGELFFVAHADSAGSPGSTASNYPWLERVRQRDDVFAGVTAYNIRDFKVASDDGLERVPGQYVSGNYHAVIGVPMAIGRGFANENDRAPGSSPIAVISDGYWARRFARSPEVIGSTLVVGGHPVTIVGVTAPGFDGLQPGRSIELTLPLSIRIQDEPDFLTSMDSWTSMPLVVRLRNGVSADVAQSALQVEYRRHMSQPEIGFARGAGGELLRSAALLPAAKGADRLRREYATPLFVLMGMAGVVLIIACLNVGNLLLVRGAARANELAVRMSLGAYRARVVRQLLTESMVLAVAGGALGLLLAGWGTRALATLLRQSQNPIVIDAQPDGTVLLFATGLSVAAAMVFGLAPAARATQIDLTPALRSAAAGVVRRERPDRKLLVAAQIALCLVLVFGAALLVRTLRNLQTLDAGFETGNVLVFALDARDTAFPAERVVPLCDELLQRLRGRPGVTWGSCSTMTPLDTAFEGRPIGIPAPPPDLNENLVFANTVTPEYFQTFGIELVRGRLFTMRDTATAPRVAIVNEAMARYYFGDQDPVGRQIAFGRQPDPGRAMTVVGLVRDARQFLRDVPPRMTYQPLAQIVEPPRNLTAAIWTSGEPGPLAAAVRGDVRTLTADVAVEWVRTMREQMAAALTRERLLAMLSSAFGGLALLLACIGVYGVMAYDITRRRRDIGIRLALGADRGTILVTVMRQAAVMVAAGIAAGVVAASLLSGVVSSFLFEVTAGDPIMLATAAAVLATTALLAGYIPARCASRLDPAAILRAE